MAETLKSVAVPLPQYTKGCSLTAFTKKLQGYFKIMGITEEGEQLAVLPLCFCGTKFDAIWESIDGKSTFKSVLNRVETFIKQEDRPTDPLVHFIERKWLPHETVYDFLRDLRKRASFITNNTSAIDDLVKLQLVRCVPDSIRPVITVSSSLNEIVSLLASISPPDQPTCAVLGATSPQSSGASKVYRSSVISDKQSRPTCYNCASLGHVSRRCRAAPAVCEVCGKKWHLAKFCLSKNVSVGPSQ